MFQIIYHDRALKFLKKISKTEFKNLTDKIQKLSTNPTDPSLDIKKLVNTTCSCRMRFRQIRIIYQIDQNRQLIYIENINFRGNVY